MWLNDCWAGGGRLVSLIITRTDVATTVPVILSVLTLAVKLSAPSLVASAVGVTVNDPEPFVIVKFPDESIKSSGFVTVQY